MISSKILVGNRLCQLSPEAYFYAPSPHDNRQETKTRMSLSLHHVSGTGITPGLKEMDNCLFFYL